MASYSCPFCSSILSSRPAFLLHVQECDCTHIPPRNCSSLTQISNTSVFPPPTIPPQEQHLATVASSTILALDSLKRQHGKDHLALDIGLSPPPSISSSPAAEFCWVPRDYFAASRTEWSGKLNSQGLPYGDDDHAYALITKAGKPTTPQLITQVVSSINDLRSAFGKDAATQICFQFLKLITEWMQNNKFSPVLTISQASDVLQEIKNQPLADDILDQIVGSLWRDRVLPTASSRKALEGTMMTQYGFCYQIHIASSSKKLGCFQRIISSKHQQCKRVFDSLINQRANDRNALAILSPIIKSRGEPIGTNHVQPTPSTPIPFQHLPRLHNPVSFPSVFPSNSLLHSFDNLLDTPTESESTHPIDFSTRSNTSNHPVLDVAFVPPLAGPSSLASPSILTTGSINDSHSQDYVNTFLRQLQTNSLSLTPEQMLLALQTLRTTGRFFLLIIFYFL